jgi:hypothetical protein
LGTAVALPLLDSLALAGPTPSAAAKGPIKRLAFLYVPNGIHMPAWTPGAEGALGKLPATLAALEPFKDKLNVLSGLALDKARANGDGPGDHARAMSAFLTGSQPRKTHGADIRVGKSADQHVAAAVGDATRFPSLELGVERGAQAGNCDSGYSCAYSNNLSWRSENTPNAKETDPKAVFERLFGGDEPKDVAEARAKREAYSQSVLDFVSEDAKGLGATLGSGDKRKLDEYLTAGREVEIRIEKVRKDRAERKPPAKPDMEMPTGTPRDQKEHIRLMCDLMVLSFQTDLTRVVTLPFANDGSNKSYPMIGVSAGHHDCSHHGNNADKQAKIQKINAFHIEQLAYLLGKMQGVKEKDGTTLLDSVMLVYGSGIGDGNRHNHDDLPILLAGGGGGTIEGGRHVKYKFNTPLMNLYLALFERIGAPAKSFGDSTGVLKV